MAEFSSLTVLMTATSLVPLLLATEAYRTLSSIYFFISYYGLAGVFICIFGSREIWRIQVQILGSNRDSDAMDFKKSAQDDSNIIAVASTILAQVAITALSLDDLSRTHWVARAFFTFSLVSSIMAVYYATSQYRILGRCLRAEQVKAWIRSTGSARHRNIDFLVGHHPGMPSAAAVLNMSAPNMLLSSSLNAFLIGLGVYLGYIWTRNLDEPAGTTGSRAVFITYVVGLVVCYCIYAMSRAVVADQSYVSEKDWLRKQFPAGSSPVERMMEDDEASTRRDGHHAEAELRSRPSAEVVVDPANQELDVERAIDLDAVPQPYNGRVRHESILQDDSVRKELLSIFQEVAKSLEASAKLDKRLVRILERIGEGVVVQL